jgi:putative SOS response-associated peptidase YedK
MQPVHDRQPAIIEPRDYEEWLAESHLPPVHLLRVLSEREMQSRLISQENMFNDQAVLFGGL